MKSAGALLACLAALLLGCQRTAPSAPVTPAAAPAPAAYSAEARALYDGMMQALRDARTLSYKSDYVWSARGDVLGRTTYQIWMSKPNYARVEAVNTQYHQQGNLVLDGLALWIWWPTGKPAFTLNDRQTGTDFYMAKPAPPLQHSIGHEVNYLGTGMSMTILDPSTFHGYTDSLQPYVDGVIGMGTEVINGETLDKIEVSIMDHQRSWYLWLSRKDRLPRKLHEVVRVDYEITTDETWSDIRINAPISPSRYRWSPPAGWKQYTMPSMEEGLLANGTEAPDFELASSAGKTVHLSSYKGKLVWLVFWRVGCPPCREEFPRLQQLSAEYGGKGVVIIGYNCSDDRDIALAFMKEYGATFPNVLDTSSEAQRTYFDKYQTLGWSGVPLNYVIDGEGKVAAAWYGYDPSDDQGEKTIERLLAAKR